MIISFLFINLILFTYLISNHDNIFNITSNIVFDGHVFNQSSLNNLGAFQTLSSNFTQNITLDQLIADGFYFSPNEIL